MILLISFFDNLYHINEKGELDPICIALDCGEQIKYHILRTYQDKNMINYNYIFCDDINLKLTYSNLKYNIRKKTHNLNGKLYNINTYENIDKPMKILEDILDQGKIAAVRTNFNTLPPYKWCQVNPNVEHSRHYFMIIGHSSEEVFFIDSPFLLDKKYNKTHSSNSTINILSKSCLEFALEQHAIIKSIEVNCAELINSNKLSSLIPLMIEEFFSTIDSVNNNVFIGKNALEKILEAIKNNDYSVFDCAFFDSHFDTHIMYSRRELLKNAILDDQNYKNKENLFKVISLLQESMQEWLKLKNLIIKKCAGKDSLFYEKTENIFRNILNTEEKMFYELKKMIE